MKTQMSLVSLGIPTLFWGALTFKNRGHEGALAMFFFNMGLNAKDPEAAKNKDNHKGPLPLGIVINIP